MDIFIFILEAITLFCLVLFAGCLNSKYYERKPINVLDDLIWVALVIYLASVMYFSLGEKYLPVALSVIWHILMLGLVYYSVNEYPKLRLKYDRQRNLAQTFLLLTISFELVTIAVAMIKYSV